MGRSEQVGQLPPHRGAYDLALVRAVGTASVCVEYALPLLRERGVAILYRGQWTGEDTTALAPVVEQLGGRITAIEAIVTPISQSIRHYVSLEKQRSTPADFPRAVGIPAKYPL
ncbi:RsmG family class I SAM-dependent methyltransferase [Neosynechococcus sphagnicola]|uniref:RsmG family class I SAM-dependent methyltransferase n=1 Tax=Neosynechococcus sphagnicola TaxID=1501145 RepID=UPI003B83070E